MEETTKDGQERPDAVQDLPPEAEVPPDRPICGFWARVLALVVDGIVMGIAGIILGLFFGDQFVQMGRWGRLVGFGITLLYFGILNSHIGKGKTLGKRLMQIRVTGVDGRHITLARSLARIAILASFFFKGPLISWDFGGPVRILAGLIFDGLGVGTVYFYLVNRTTRQSLHDLIVRTCVVRDAAAKGISLPPIARFHYIVLGALVVILTGTCCILPLLFPLYSQGHAAIEKLNQIESIRNAEFKIVRKYWPGDSYKAVEIGIIMQGRPASYTSPYTEQDATQRGRLSGWKHSRSLTGFGLSWSTEGIPLSMLSPPPLAACKAIAKDAARIAVGSYPGIESIDRIIVTVKYGYDIGISSEWLYCERTWTAQSGTDWERIRQELGKNE